LIVDELGYLPLSREQAHQLFQVIAKRYEVGSTSPRISRSASGTRPSPAIRHSRQRSLTDCCHHAAVIMIKGESYRLKD
jgi:DNA replication protein DnaC